MIYMVLYRWGGRACCVKKIMHGQVIMFKGAVARGWLCTLESLPLPSQLCRLCSAFHISITNMGPVRRKNTTIDPNRSATTSSSTHSSKRHMPRRHSELDVAAVPGVAKLKAALRQTKRLLAKVRCAQHVIF
jgi:hypothetical protein